jgi:hypothetical protein
LFFGFSIGPSIWIIRCPTSSTADQEQLHRACADLLRLYEARGLLAFCHVPNGFGRTPAEAGIAKALGQRAGVPDLLVWLPGGWSFDIELKAGKRPLSPAQKHGTPA